MNPNMIVVAHERPARAHALVTAFTAAGYEAAGALTFRDALNLVADCGPAMLVVNAEQGSSSGLPLAQRCASDFPWIKIVVVGPADAALEREARALGASAYVRRPAEPAEVVDRAAATLAATAPTLLAPPAGLTHA